MSRFLSPRLDTVTPYTPGEQPQDQQYIKLNTNESPYPPSPAVLEAVSRSEVEKLRLYSDPACTELLNAAAKHFGLRPDQIMPGNGSDENLFFALRSAKNRFSSLPLPGMIWSGRSPKCFAAAFSSSVQAGSE